MFFPAHVAPVLGELIIIYDNMSILVGSLHVFSVFLFQMMNVLVSLVRIAYNF